MEKERLAAFSDGVLAIIITIMVLELKSPAGGDWASLSECAPQLASYILSFLYIAIYWNNHHHLLHTVERVNGSILWANMHLLFWLSLIPFATSWLWQEKLSAAPSAFYGFLLLMAALAYYILQKTIIAEHGQNALLGQALGHDMKGKISPILYSLGILLAFVSPPFADILFALVAVMWLIPDSRIENKLRDTQNTFH